MSIDAEISARHFDDLVSGNLVEVRSGLATLCARGVMPERRFFMQGPSGIHSLLVCATDRDRLNAHRSVFSKHEANR